MLIKFKSINYFLALVINKVIVIVNYNLADDFVLLNEWDL